MSKSKTRLRHFTCSCLSSGSFGLPLTVRVFVLSYYPDSWLLTCLQRKGRQTRILRWYQGGGPASLLLDPRMFLASHPPQLFRRKVNKLCALRLEDCEQQVQICKLAL